MAGGRTQRSRRSISDFGRLPANGSRESTGIGSAFRKRQKWQQPAIGHFRVLKALSKAARRSCPCFSSDHISRRQLPEHNRTFITVSIQTGSPMQGPRLTVARPFAYPGMPKNGSYFLPYLGKTPDQSAACRANLWRFSDRRSSERAGADFQAPLLGDGR